MSCYLAELARLVDWTSERFVLLIEFDCFVAVLDPAGCFAGSESVGFVAHGFDSIDHRSVAPEIVQSENNQKD